jgi:hypothetical protein
VSSSSVRMVIAKQSAAECARATKGVRGRFLSIWLAAPPGRGLQLDAPCPHL